MRIAGVERGQGRRRRAAAHGRAGRAGDDADRRQGPADPQGRDVRDPPAHLPRGQLLRRPPPRHPVGAELGDGDTIPSPRPRRRSSSTRSSPRCSPTRARTSRRCSSEYGTGLSGGAPRASTRRSRTGSPPTATRRSSTRRRSGSNAHDLSGYIQGRRHRRPARSTSSPPALKNLITDFNITAARVRGAAGQPLGDGRRAAAHAARRPARRSPRSTTRSRRCARLVVDFRPARAVLAARRSTPACRSCAQARGLVSQPELRGLAADLRPTVPGAGPPQRSERPALPAGARGLELPEQGDPARGRRTSSPDPQLPGAGRHTVYQEPCAACPGLAGESRSGDANGQWFRVLPGNGANIYNLTGLRGAGGVFGTTALPDPGRQPAQAEAARR